MDAVLGCGIAPEVVHETAPEITIDDMDRVDNLEDAVSRVLKEAMITDGMKRGVNEVVKAIESKKAHVVFLSENVQEESITKVITLLAKKNDIPLIQVPDSKALGQWAGLCKYDRDGQPRKIVGAACVALNEFGVVSAGYDYLQKHISSVASN